MGQDCGRIDAAAAILAGGSSRRMGEDKASLPWRGEPLGLWVARRLSEWFDEVVVSADDPGVFAGGPWRIVPDEFKGGGVLAGLHGSLLASSKPFVFMSACDMPFIVEDLVRFLWSLTDGSDVVIPFSAEGPEPLCAFYSRSCLDPAARALSKGERRVISFFDEVRVRRVEEAEWRRFDRAGDSFLNINTPGDYRRFAKRIEGFTAPGK